MPKKKNELNEINLAPLGKLFESEQKQIRRRLSGLHRISQFKLSRNNNKTKITKCDIKNVKIPSWYNHIRKYSVL